MIVSIIAFIIILLVLVLFHEVGHFLTAKWRGVRIIEFGIGFPPRVYSFKRGDVIYSINALPIGGFVKLAGEEDPKVPGSLASKGYFTRLLVLAAGSIMNLIAPLILFSMAFMLPHNALTGDVVIDQVAVNSPAEQAGLQAGDIVLSVNDIKINNLSELQRFVQLNLGREITMTVRHANLSVVTSAMIPRINPLYLYFDGTDNYAQVVTLKMIPRWSPPVGQGATGVASHTANPVITSTSEPPWRAIPMGFTQSLETMVLFKNEIVRWVIGAAAPQVTGPVGIAQVTGEVAKGGISPLFEFAAFISINLGIINIFPLPALDGGRIVFVLLEMIRRGKRVSPKTEGLIHFIGFALLIAFALAVTYNDITNIIDTGSAIP